jgi:hypothetical protein
VEVFAGFETDGLAGGNADFGSGARVAPNAGLARFHGEDSEATQLNAITCDQRLFHAAEDGVDGSLCLGSGKSSPLDNPLNQVLFDQFGPPLLRHLQMCSLSLHIMLLNLMLGTNRKIVNGGLLP